MKLKKLKKKWVITGSVVLVVAIIAAVSLLRPEDTRTLVQADLVIAEDISEVVTASGRIQPQTKVDIVAEVSGEIIGVMVNEGEWVTKGQSLLLLDTIQTKADVAQARYSLDELIARTEAARTRQEIDHEELERQNRLFEKKLASDAAHNNALLAFENSKANYQANLAQVKIGRARLEKAEDSFTKTHIRAPMDGVITFLNAEVGEIAQAQTAFTQGRTLMTISDLSVFEVEIDVDETEIAKVGVGQTAAIRVDAFRDTSFEGIVTEIGNSAAVTGQGTQDLSTSFRVKIRFADVGVAVRPGMSATVDVTTATANEATLVPYAAVVTREFDPDSLKAAGDTPPTVSSGIGEVNAAPVETASDDGAADTTEGKGRTKGKKKVKKSGVFLIKGGKAEFVEVPTGIADERNIVARSGVAIGDTVISGSFQTLRKLSNGDGVKIDESSLEKMGKDDDA